MWKIDRPTTSAEDAFETCISRIMDDNLKARMRTITDTIIAAGETYANVAETAKLHLTAAQAEIDGIVTIQEMTKLYNGRMAKAKSPGRRIYDSLIAAAEHGRCPFCGHRIVSTLDHVLPKAHYPALAVLPDNLVPACADCNKMKGSNLVIDAVDQYLHPYFDTIEDDLWLRGELLETSPATMRFFVECPMHWDALTGARVRRHFDRLALGKLYASQAAQELVNIRYQLSLIHKHTGTVGVKQSLGAVN